jgi:hypothetical protein
MRNVFLVTVYVFVLVLSSISITGIVFADGAEVETSARHSGKSIDATMGTTPTIDGAISNNEWSDATTATINLTNATATLYVKHDGTDLYAAFSSSFTSMCELVFDMSHDGGSNPQTDDVLLHASAALYEKPGTGSGWSSTQSSANGWSANTGFPTAREFKVSFTKLGITSGNAKTIGAGFVIMTSGAGSGMWPNGGSKYNPGTWGDLSSSDNWGTGGPVNIAPVLSGGMVDPNSGFTDTDFNFNVTYRDQNDDTPTVKKIVIDGNEYDMTTTDTTYTDGSNFEYTSVLPAGDHKFYFKFNDGLIEVRLPLLGEFDGPTVIVPNAAPTLITGKIPNGTFSIDEDSGSGNDLIDLEVYFEDDRDDGNLSFEIVYEEDNSKLDAVIDGSYMDFEQLEENWFGKLEFQVKAKDRGLDGIIGGGDDLESNSNIFTVIVNSVPDPAVLTKVGTKNVIEGSDIKFAGSDSAVEDELFSFDIVAADADIDMGEADSLSFETNSSLKTIGLDPVDPLTAHASFSPTNEDVGVLYVEITVKDSTGTEVDDSVNVEIDVKNTNDLPKIVSITQNGGNVVIQDKLVEFTGANSAHEESWFNFTVVASDPDIDIGESDELFFSANISMDNFEIDKSTGEAAFWPRQEDVGTIYIKLKVRDEEDLSTDDYVDIIIEVANVNDPPVDLKVNSETGKLMFLEGDYVNLSAVAKDTDLDYDDNEKLTFTWVSDKDGTLGQGDSISSNSLSTGIHSITVTATDSYGKSIETIFSINVKASAGSDIDDKDDDDDDGSGTGGDKDKNSPADEKSSDQNRDYLWIVLVVLIVMVVLTMFLIISKKKKKAEPAELPTAQAPVPGQYPATEAGGYYYDQGQQRPQPQQPQNAQLGAVPVEQPLLPAGAEGAAAQVEAAVPQQPAAADPSHIAQTHQAELTTTQQPHLQQTAMVCPTCGQPLSFISESNMNYCYQCQQYR